MQAQSHLAAPGAGGSAPEDEHEAVIRELTRGHELTARLQAEALRALRGQGQAEATASFILREVSRAFTVCLSIMRSPSPALALPPPGPPPPPTSAAAATSRIRDDSVPRNRQVVTHSPDLLDGYQWRKYGQKRITNTNYPRCYYRCSLHRERGCPATKQVQQHGDGDPPQYLVIYVNEHRCDTATWEPRAAAAPAPGPVTANAPLDLSSSSLGLTTTARRNLPDERRVQDQEEHERQLLVSSLACVLGCRSPAAAVAVAQEQQDRPEPPLQGRVRDASAPVVGAPAEVTDADAGLQDAMDYDATTALFFDDSYCGPGLSDDGFPF